MKQSILSYKLHIFDGFSSKKNTHTNRRRPKVTTFGKTVSFSFRLAHFYSVFSPLLSIFVKYTEKNSFFLAVLKFNIVRVHFVCLLPYSQYKCFTRRCVSYFRGILNIIICRFSPHRTRVFCFLVFSLSLFLSRIAVICFKNVYT